MDKDEGSRQAPWEPAKEQKGGDRPRQGGAGQSWASLSGPVQSDPLFRGGGSMQACVRTCVPLPQVAEQSDHTDHGVQPPSTGANTKQPCGD